MLLHSLSGMDFVTRLYTLHLYITQLLALTLTRSRSVLRESALNTRCLSDAARRKLKRIFQWTFLTRCRDLALSAERSKPSRSTALYPPTMLPPAQRVPHLTIVFQLTCPIMRHASWLMAAAAKLNRFLRASKSRTCSAVVTILPPLFRYLSRQGIYPIPVADADFGGH